MKAFSSPQSATLFPYFFVLIVLIFAAIRYVEDLTYVLRQPFLQQPQQLLHGAYEKQNKELESQVQPQKNPEHCNIFEGKWVYDEASRPHYAEKNCPYITSQLSCEAQGRPDLMYQHWRWQPYGCSVPNFNSSHMLETLRGKRMLFIGDSITRGQFYSMVCLLHQAIPNQIQSIKTTGSLLIFNIEEYNARIEFYWAPFLVESNCDDPNIHKIEDRIIRVGSIKKHAKHWKGAHVIVFNSYNWWANTRAINFKILNGSFKGDMKDIKMMKKEDAYKLALRKMVKWLERNINPEKAQVFFSNISPIHQWSPSRGELNCYNVTMPLELKTYRGLNINKPIMKTIAELLPKAKVPIILLNVTQLSDYRKDAHPSIYKKQWSKLTPEKIRNPSTYADCMHWCLPGLQDTWNELLYAKLFFP